MQPADAAGHAGRLRRSLASGIELLPDGGAPARVWAPACRRVEVAIERVSGGSAVVPLDAERGGFFSGDLDGARAGDRYVFVLDDERRRPDPVSRCLRRLSTGASAAEAAEAEPGE